MIHAALDPYLKRESLLHRLDPRVKVVFTLLFILSNSLLPDGAWLAFGIAWGLLLVSAWQARLPLTFALKRSLIVLPFTLAAVTVIFTLPGETVARWGSISISDTGLIRFASILIRSWLSVQMAILLTATTPFPDLMHALHHLHIPKILIAIISFMYRYLFVLVAEAGRLLRARAARSARLSTDSGGGTLLWRAQIAGQMVGQLLVRSLERSDRVYQAMVARGYRGQLLTMTPHVMQHQDWLLGLAGLLLIGLIQVSGRF